MTNVSYADAINQALHQIMERKPEAFLIGQGVTSPWYVGSTTSGLFERFGAKRVIDSPVSECAVTGIALGASLAGLHPILVHPRMDFMYYAMDPIANHAAPWHSMFGGQVEVPLIIWAIINRGGEQGAQHSQAIHALLSHIPGLTIVMPSTPYDAKGLLCASIEIRKPVVFIDDRWLYSISGEVPEKYYTVPIGKAVVRRAGEDVTVVCTSYLTNVALKSADIVARRGIQAEIIDLRTAKPLDRELILASLTKTRRLIVIDGGWNFCGYAAEICAVVAESPIFTKLKNRVVRVTLPDLPAPASSELEKEYYIRDSDVVRAIEGIMEP